MINRILIRIKVVQILYSYLLSRNEFKIDPAPAGASRDRRFAYAVYLDMLMLVQELSGCRTSVQGREVPILDIDKKLRANRVGRALAENELLKDVVARRGADGLNAIAPLIQQLSDKITASAVYADYAKHRNHELDDDVKFWTVILETTILKDPALTQVLRENPDFTLSGLHHGIYAAIDTLRSYNDTRAAYQKARKDLDASLEKASELYYALFALITEITQEQTDRFEAAKGKYLATAVDLNPETRFVDNRFARFLAEDARMQKFVEDHSFTWVDAPGLLSGLLDLILASDIYADYMALPETDWATDCEFWRNVMRSVILPSDALAEALENKSIYWNDDLSTMGTFVLKTIRRFASSDGGAGVDFLPAYKDDEDEAFGRQLFAAAVDNREQYRALIDRFINTDWDPERLAFMDIIIMITAIAEIVNFPGIPIPVSLNEYIEIANSYSTRRSGPFINGILYSVIKTLIDEGRIKKPFNVAGEEIQNQ